MRMLIRSAYPHCSKGPPTRSTFSADALPKRRRWECDRAEEEVETLEREYEKASATTKGNGKAKDMPRVDEAQADVIETVGLMSMCGVVVDAD